MENAHILIVEDNVIVAEDIRVKLGHMGYKNTAIATSYEKAIKAAEIQPPDLTLMDINLGSEKTGIDVARELRRMYQTPIVYLTAYADDRTIDSAKTTEPYGYLSKPFEDSELKSAVKIALYKQQADKKIRESQQWLQITLSSIGDGVIATDEKGHVTFMNAVAESLTGWTAGEAAGKTMQEVFHIINETTLQEVENPVEAVFREGVVVGLANHTLLVARNGSTIPVADSGAPIINNKGNIIGAVLVFRDQTEERAHQKAVEESEKRYRDLYESAPIAHFSVDAKGYISKCNSKAAELIGCSKEALVGKPVVTLYADTPQGKEKAMQVLARLREGKTVAEQELQMQKDDGTSFWVSLTMNVIKDTDGETVESRSMVVDITERKRVEAERELLIQCIEQSGETTLITDKHGIIIYANRAFEKETGYSREEAIGQTPRILKSGRQDQAFYARLWATISAGQTFSERMVNKRKDGTLYTESAIISPVFNEAGTIVNYIGVKRDITRHLEMEEQLYQAQKLESIGQLAGGVAHDYNNALSVILGFTELVMKKVDPAGSMYEDLREVYDAAMRSAEVTRQLLAFARKQTIMPRVLDLNETVVGMLRMLQRLLGEDIKLSWQPMANLWHVKIDSSQVDQILANLCINARHAISGVGRIIIETGNVQLDADYCSSHAEAVPGDYVLLMISDDGCGITKEDQKKIFEPFFTTRQVGKGTGLGLATVYGIVKQNNGLISVYSEPGQGTTFKIYLPRHAVPEKELKDAPDKIALPQGYGETVLIVEDEATTLKLAKRILTGLGYTVLDAIKPQQAMDLARKHQDTIKLLLTDVIMPEMNGSDLADQLRILCPGLKVVFMSGYTADIINSRGVLSKGMNFIQKPFSSRDLAVTVREELDKTPDEGELR